MSKRELYDPLLSPVWESLDQDRYLVATYIVAAGVKADAVAKAVALAIEQSTGSWTAVPGETPQVRERSTARVIGLYAVPDYELISHLPDQGLRHYVLRVAFPWANFDDNLPLLLSSVIGNISSMPNLKLVDLEFPESWVSMFRGPKFGVAGVRKLLGVPKRPLLNNMIKPCTGLSPDEGAALLREAAAGGADWVKDDELIAADRCFSGLEERVRKYMAAAREADREKGESTLYTVNITAPESQLLDLARRAIDSGTNALMVNVFACGLTGLRLLAESPEVTVPIMAHSCFGGAISTAPFSGISSPVAAKLARLCGADIYLNVVPSAKFNQIRDKFVRVWQTCTARLYHVSPVFCLTGGGVTPGMVPYLMDMVGSDCVIGAGAAVHGHPMGPRAGARAFRQAINAVMNGNDLAEAARQQPELAAALEKWGIYDEHDYRKLYDIEG